MSKDIVKTKCLECGEEFGFRRRPGRRPGFCKERCRKEWHRKGAIRSYYKLIGHFVGENHES